MPLQVASAAAGVPVWQLSRSWPSTQLVAPVAAQAPTPQLVAAGAKSSSIEPSQSSSTPSQVASEVAVDTAGGAGAGAGTDAAAGGGGREVFVDRAVAVVIDAVASVVEAGDRY